MPGFASRMVASVNVRVLSVGLALGVGLAVAAPVAARGTDGPVTARLQLDHAQVAQGKPVHGHLVFHNPGGSSVDLNHGCTPKWDVVLGSGRYAPAVAFSLECGTEPFPVKPGTTRMRFTANTNGPPRLRAGRYHAFLVASDPSFPKARPVAVRIVAKH
jgi:hypothetical protein